MALHQRHRGLTEALAQGFAEAAAVCVARHHASPTAYNLWDGERRTALVLEWEKPDERCRAAWANLIEATESGAIALALAALETCTGLVAVRRADTRTGCDYYVGPPGSGRLDLEHCLRLEISGVDRGSPSVVHRRVFQKVQQAIRGDSNLPAMVGVVGFRASLVIPEPVEAE